MERKKRVVIYVNNTRKAGLPKVIITMSNKVPKTIEFYSIIKYGTVTPENVYYVSTITLIYNVH